MIPDMVTLSARVNSTRWTDAVSAGRPAVCGRPAKGGQ